jgi:hypothetical protein
MEFGYRGMKKSTFHDVVLWRLSTIRNWSETQWFGLGCKVHDFSEWIWRS